MKTVAEKCTLQKVISINFRKTGQRGYYRILEFRKKYDFKKYDCIHTSFLKFHVKIL